MAGTLHGYLTSNPFMTIFEDRVGVLMKQQASDCEDDFIYFGFEQKELTVNEQLIAEVFLSIFLQCFRKHGAAKSSVKILVKAARKTFILLLDDVKSQSAILRVIVTTLNIISTILRAIPTILKQFLTILRVISTTLSIIATTVGFCIFKLCLPDAPGALTDFDKSILDDDITGIALEENNSTSEIPSAALENAHYAEHDGKSSIITLEGYDASAKPADEVTKARNSNVRREVSELLAGRGTGGSKEVPKDHRAHIVSPASRKEELAKDPGEYSTLLYTAYNGNTEASMLLIDRDVDSEVAAYNEKEKRRSNGYDEKQRWVLSIDSEFRILDYVVKYSLDKEQESCPINIYGTLTEAEAGTEPSPPDAWAVTVEYTRPVEDALDNLEPTQNEIAEKCFSNSVHEDEYGDLSDEAMGSRGKKFRPRADDQMHRNAFENCSKAHRSNLTIESGYSVNKIKQASAKKRYHTLTPGSIVGSPVARKANEKEDFLDSAATETRKPEGKLNSQIHKLSQHGIKDVLDLKGKTNCGENSTGHRVNGLLHGNISTLDISQIKSSHASGQSSLDRGLQDFTHEDRAAIRRRIHELRGQDRSLTRISYGRGRVLQLVYYVPPGEDPNSFWDKKRITESLQDVLGEGGTVKLQRLNQRPEFAWTTMNPGKLAGIAKKREIDKFAMVAAFVNVEGKGLHALLSGHKRQTNDKVFDMEEGGNFIGKVNVVCVSRPNSDGPAVDTALAHLEGPADCGYRNVVTDGSGRPVYLGEIADIDNILNQIRLGRNRFNQQAANQGAIIQIYNRLEQNVEDIHVFKFTSSPRQWSPEAVFIDQSDIILPERNTSDGFFRDFHFNGCIVVGRQQASGNYRPIHTKIESGTLITTPLYQHTAGTPFECVVEPLGTLSALYREQGDEYSLAVPITESFRALQSEATYCNGRRITFHV